MLNRGRIRPVSKRRAARLAKENTNTVNLGSSQGAAAGCQETRKEAVYLTGVGCDPLCRAARVARGCEVQTSVIRTYVLNGARVAALRWMSPLSSEIHARIRIRLFAGGKTRAVVWVAGATARKPEMRQTKKEMAHVQGTRGKNCSKGPQEL